MPIFASIVFAHSLTTARAASTASNVYAEPCKRATVAAIACCSSFACDTDEVMKKYGNVLDGGTPTAAQESGVENSQRLAELLKKTPAVRAGMAQLCVQRGDTCLKQCGNAAKTGSLKSVAAYTLNERTCTAAKARGQALLIKAGNELSDEEDARAKVAADKILTTSSNLANLSPVGAGASGSSQ